MQFNFPLWFFLVLAPIGGFFARQCPFPGIPANGNVKVNNQTVTWQQRTNYQVGDKIEFFCDYGREIPSFHQSEIECRNNGTWSGPLPRCDLKSDWEKWNVQYISSRWELMYSSSGCANPSSSYWYISTRRTKNVNDSISEIHITTCHVSDRTNNTATVAVEDMPCIQDSRDPWIFNCENVTTHHLSSLEHHIGVSFKFPATIQSVSILINLGNNCGWPPVPLDADVSTYTKAGQTEVSYKCYSPFPFASNEHRSSQCDPLTGQWTEPLECTCPTSALTHFVEIIQMSKNSLEYQCKWPRIGHDIIFCDANRDHWSSQPRCFCPPHNFSYIQSAHRNASQLPYQCKSELNLTGSGQLTCDLKTGQWSQPDCSCRQLTPPAFVQFIRQNNVINYECTDPFVGNGSLTCDLLTGNWSTVNCKCRDPVLPEFASISSRTDDSISLSCPNYLELTGSQIMVCDTITGQWKLSSSHQLSQCRCREPDPPPHAANQRINASTIKYSCEKELKLFGPSLISCNMKTGVWSTSPECGCLDPSAVANAQMERTGPTTASYSCRNGLKLLGTANLQCDPRSNKWDALPPRCSCQDPAPIDNAVSQQIDNDTVIYRCSEGFELIGSSNISCNLTSGEWSPKPKCRCTAPLLPWKLTAVNRTDFSIQLQCPEELELVGSKQLNCSKNTGQWDELPNCRCPKPVDPLYGNGFDRTDLSIKYKCDDGFEMVGNSTVYCDRTSGRWNPLPKCRCVAPPTPENATTVKREDTFIQYKCNEDFEITGNAIISCDESGQWTTRPKCTRPVAFPPTAWAIPVGSVAICVVVISFAFYLCKMKQISQQLLVKPNTTGSIKESSQHGTDLSIAVNEGTREPSDDDAVQRVANGGYEVPPTLEEVNEPVYTVLNEVDVCRNPGDVPRSFDSCDEPIYFELNDPRFPSKPAANDADTIQESAYVEMSPFLYTNLASSVKLEQSVDNPIEGKTGKHPLHCPDAEPAQSDENGQYSNLTAIQLYADVAACQPEQNPVLQYSNIHQGMDQEEQ